MRYKVQLQFPKSSILIIVIFMLNTSISSQLFSAIDGLEDILNTEKVLIDSLENYISAEEQRLALLKRHTQMYRNHLREASEDVEAYVTNPINAYILIKKLTADWNKTQDIITKSVAEDFMRNLSILKENNAFPTYEDLNGAAVAITRIQETYQLESTLMANGILSGVKYNTELNSDDCFQLGLQLFDIDHHVQSMSWMRQAYLKLENLSSIYTLEKSDILEYIAYSSYEMGNITLALALTEEFLKLKPNDSAALGNKEFYENMLRRFVRDESVNEHAVTESGVVDDRLDSYYESATEHELFEDVTPYETQENETEVEQRGIHVNYEEYRAACRGEVSPPIEMISKLKCKYVNNGNPYLFLAPFKMEEAHMNPSVYIFHDVISDGEIETVKRLGRSRFFRAYETNPENGEPTIPQYRICKIGWLEDEDDKQVAVITQRVGDMTKLSMKSAESLQVANYGIGGQYEPHYDFAGREDLDEFDGKGDRTATVLFYMSDVAQGGATVFPNLRLTVWPKKGSAVFWYNLHESGEGDIRTRHAACPVLAGSKWVANKWLHEQDQEFLRPCSLDLPPRTLVRVEVLE